MSAEQAVVEAAVGAVREPSSTRLVELGMVVRAHEAPPLRCRPRFPTAAWPSGNEVLEAVRAAALGVDGIDEVSIEHGVMDETERASCAGPCG